MYVLLLSIDTGCTYRGVRGMDRPCSSVVRRPAKGVVRSYRTAGWFYGVRHTTEVRGTRPGASYHGGAWYETDRKACRPLKCIDPRCRAPLCGPEPAGQRRRARTTGRVVRPAAVMRTATGCHIHGGAW